MKVEVQDVVIVIRGLGKKFENFHLSNCICGAPMWQQPCTICGYYPQWGYDREYEIRTGKSPHEDLRNTCTKEMYSKLVKSTGTFLEHYFRSFYRCRDPEFVKLQDARDEARSFEWPTPEEIWDYYRRSDINCSGQVKKSK